MSSLLSPIVLKRLYVQNWIEIDEEYEADIELRRKLVAEQRDIVIQSTPEVLSPISRQNEPTLPPIISPASLFWRIQKFSARSILL